MASRGPLAFALVAFIAISPRVVVADNIGGDVLHPKDTVEDIISKFRADTQSLIDHAGAEARATLVEAYQLADVLIQSLQVIYEKELNYTFDKLDAQQRMAFEATAHALDEFRQGVENPVREISIVSENWATIMAKLTLHSPVITRYRPAYVPPIEAGRDFVVEVDGYNLAAGRPALVIGDHEYKDDNFLIEKLPNRLRFRIPRSTLSGEQENTGWASYKLTVYKDGWLGSTPLDYRIVQTMLPSQLGAVNYHQVVITPRRNSDWFETEQQTTSSSAQRL